MQNIDCNRAPSWTSVGNGSFIFFWVDDHIFSIDMTYAQWRNVWSSCCKNDSPNCRVNLKDTEYDVSQTDDTVSFTMKRYNKTYTFPKSKMLDLIGDIAFN